MGASGSKASKTVAGAGLRKYPSKPSGQVQSAPGTSSRIKDSSHLKVNAQGQVSSTRDEAIDLDARDPHFGDSLRKIGPVQPFPTFSPSSRSAPQADGSNLNQGQRPGYNSVYPSSASNPALAILAARSRIQDEIEQEKIDAGRKNYPGRKFLDATTIRKVLVLRDEEGMKTNEIELALKLRPGSVASLGRVGVVEAA